MQSLEFYRDAFLAYLGKRKKSRNPQTLYEPVDYIMGLGGKRLRPVLALMGCELFGGDHNKALPAAMAVEVFHNFSLVHDDIMDDAPLRRGQPTVHEKWNVNTGILSGDAMLINAYQCLEAYEGPVLKELFRLFSKTAIEVCEGQQYDVDFETRNDVALAEYLKMIEYKTAVLIAAALKMGAIVADTTKENQDLIYEFGRNLGIAFQLQDDYLDAFGNPETFGKQVGGDIIENKKTFLYIKALQQAVEADKKTLAELFAHQPTNTDSKVATVKEIFKNSGAMEATKREIERFTQIAFDSLHKVVADKADKKIFEDFGKKLMLRTV